MKQLIKHFAQRHFLVNLITIMVLLGGVVAWHATNKEELPDITFNFVRISTSYSGASAEDVEVYVTKPIEEALLGVDGVRRITSSSGAGSSSISVELERTIKDIDKMVTEIQSQVAGVNLPDDILDDPRVRVFETSKKAIIDIAIYNVNKPLLSVPDRSTLQHYARGLETKLLAEPEIFEVRRQGYLKEEVNIQTNPKRFIQYEIALNTIAQEIERNHIRAPSGTLKSGKFEQITVLSELDNKQKLDTLVVQGGFDSLPIKLRSVAQISDGFEDQRTIFKVNGREAVLFNVVKTSGYGILETLESVKKVVTQYKTHSLKKTPIQLTFLDDESIDVRNRLSIISSNGVLGFILIVITLLVFLNKRSGFWVALGIPFTLCFTLIVGKILGFTINGITLAGVIIVLGIVVDDAIIVAENITRRFNEGEPLSEASIKGAQEVIAPILASILTTCAAFFPLMMFSGRFGLFVKYIPPIIFLMLLASILESFFLLPAHMALFPKKRNASSAKVWFNKWESIYETLINRILPLRYWVIGLFIILGLGAGFIANTHLKFVMFPNEESREIVLSGDAKHATSAAETAVIIQPIEDFLTQYIGKQAVGIRTEVARGRRGDVSSENQFRTTLELIPKEKRKTSSKAILAEIEAFINTLDTIENVKFRRQRFGQSSGSVFEIIVSENDDLKRDQLVKDTIEKLKKNKNMANIEPDIIPLQKEYQIDFNQDELKRLSVNPTAITATLRTILNGKRLYTLLRNDEEIDVNLTVTDTYRQTIDKALQVPIENNRNYLIPLKELVSVKEVMSKKSIRRQDHKRTSFIYADLAPNASKSPLEVAHDLETSVFPELLADYPSSQLSFEGEIIDSRESQRDLKVGILTALCFIYLTLAILFDSALKPLRIMIIIPFGVIGVVLAFYAHQKLEFGFYAAIGTLGMLGVVVNDAIVMLNKLDREEQPDTLTTTDQTASIAKTRLRAIVLTTLTTVAGVMPTAYGFGGTDTMLSDMMISMAWGLLFGTLITLILTPCTYMIEQDLRKLFRKLNPIKKPHLLLIPFLILIPVKTWASDSVNKIIPLNLFITEASKKDTQFHTLLLEQLALKHKLAINTASPELALDIASNFSLNTSLKSNTHTISLSQTLPDFGQTLSMSYSESSPSSQTSSFTFSQDIARNAFGTATQLNTVIETLKNDILKHQLIEAYEDYLGELTSLYYTWMRQHESLKLGQAALRENQKVLDSILARQKKKIANETDVNKLRLQTLAKQEQVIALEQTYLETTNLIKRAMQHQDESTIQPNSDIILDTLPEKSATILSEMKRNSRTFILLETLSKQAGLEKDQALRDLLPSAQLSATLANTTDPYGLIGVSISVPFLNLSAKETSKLKSITQKQTEANNQTTLTRLSTTISNLYQGLFTQTKLIDIAIEKKKVALRILNSESENYSYGKITLNDYLDAVNRYDNARFDEINSKIKYQTLSLELKRLTDQLVTKTSLL